MDCLGHIIDLGCRYRTARIEYRKPGEKDVTVRVVEPYSIRYCQTAPGAVCWQVAPRIKGEPAWRTFRCDRMVSVTDGGDTFKPRIPVTMSTTETYDVNWETQTSEAHGYFLWLEKCLLDHCLTDVEISRAIDIAASLPVEEMRGVHGRIYANVLEEVIADGRVTEKEEAYLSHVRQSLGKLGYRP